MHGLAHRRNLIAPVTWPSLLNLYNNVLVLIHTIDPINLGILKTGSCWISPFTDKDEREHIMTMVSLEWTKTCYMAAKTKHSWAEWTEEEIAARDAP